MSTTVVMIASSEGTAIGGRTTVRTLPPPPDPSTDPRLDSKIKSPSPGDTDDPDDIFCVSPTVAKEHLAAAIEALVQMTGDILATPPPPGQGETAMRKMHEEKVNIVRTHSARSVARMREETLAKCSVQIAEDDNVAGCDTSRDGKGNRYVQRDAPALDYTFIESGTGENKGTVTGFGSAVNTNAVDGVPGLRMHPPSGAPYILVGDDAQQVNKQHSVITRKFYSKKPPPISVTDYLARIHTYCPMSTAVYLATSLYVHRLAVEERAVVVTRRNVHRLLLAGLRVAMKALEDHTYPPGKFAAVGGVSKPELGRLEVGFCFLTSFELAITPEILTDHWRSLRRGLLLHEDALNRLPIGFELTLSRLKRNDGI